MVESSKMELSLTKLVLFGAGGLGREIAVLIKQINNIKPTFDLLGFIVDSEYLVQQNGCWKEKMKYLVLFALGIQKSESLYLNA